MNSPSFTELRMAKRPKVVDKASAASKLAVPTCTEHGSKDGTPMTVVSVAIPASVFRLPTRIIRRPKKSILNKIMTHPELMLAFVSHLTPASLVSLYAISKPFHYLFNRHYTTFILANVRTNCGPDPEVIFPHYAYKRLCKLDPTARDVNAPHPLAALRPPTASDNEITELPDENEGPKLRLIPGIKWLQMVVHRMATLQRILAWLCAAGFLMPFHATLLALQKLWFTLDLATNGLRIGCIHNRALWTDADLKVAWFFFTTLDKRFTDPIDGTGCASLRQLLLRRRSLTPLLAALERRTFRSQIELLQFVVCLQRGASDHLVGWPVLGLSVRQVGRGDREGHGRGSRALLPPDDLVMMELLRRRLNPSKLILSFMIAGRGRQLI